MPEIKMDQPEPEVEEDYPQGEPGKEDDESSAPEDSFERRNNPRHKEPDGSKIKLLDYDALVESSGGQFLVRQQRCRIRRMTWID